MYFTANRCDLVSRKRNFFYFSSSIIKMERSLALLRTINKVDPEMFTEITQAKVYDFSVTHPAPTHPERTDPQNNRVVVVNDDCLRVTDKIARSCKYGTPLLLNMANAINCGGEGFNREDAKGSQEEYLFRHTSIAASLWPRRRSNDNRWSEANDLFERGPTGYDDIFYPFSSAGGVYSPQVLIHAIEHQPVSLDEMMTSCAVVSIAAQDLRPTRTYNKDEVFNYALTMEKLRTCLYIAVRNGHTPSQNNLPITRP